MTIRPGDPRDFEAVFDLWEALIAHGHRADPRFAPVTNGRQRFAQWARQDWRTARVLPPILVAEQEGQVCGFLHGRTDPRLEVIADASLPMIADLYVAPTHRRQGLGRQLVSEYTRRAKEAGFSAVDVNLLSLDHQAAAFWTALGFGQWMVQLRRPL